MWVGLTSIPSRTWGINVILREGGALYRNIPPNAVRFKEEAIENWRIEESQLWNCYSYNFSILQNPILTGLQVTAKVGPNILKGTYLFSTTHLFDGWSDSPEQDKEFIFIELTNGRLTIQPTNRVTITNEKNQQTRNRSNKKTKRRSIRKMEDRKKFLLLLSRRGVKTHI